MYLDCSSIIREFVRYCSDILEGPDFAEINHKCTESTPQKQALNVNFEYNL